VLNEAIFSVVLQLRQMKEDTGCNKLFSKLLSASDIFIKNRSNIFYSIKFTITSA